MQPGFKRFKHIRTVEVFLKLFLLGTVLLICALAAYGVMSLLCRLLSADYLKSIVLNYGSIFLTIFFLLLTGNYYVYRGVGQQADIVRRGDDSEPRVALTFDDGPSPLFTPAVLELLRRNQIPATFFLLGSEVDQYPELLEEIIADGHEVGIHSYNHLNLPALTTPALFSQVIQTIISIINGGGGYPCYLRPPRGLYNSQLRRLAQLLGLKIVLWSLSSEDWVPGRSPEALVQRVINRVSPGDILLFHDGGGLINGRQASRHTTVQALPQIIQGLRDKGYEIVSLAELLADVHPELQPVSEMVLSQDWSQ